MHASDARNDERGAIQLVEGVLAVAAVALASVTVFLGAQASQRQHRALPVTARLVEQVNVNTDLAALASYDPDVPQIIASHNTVSVAPLQIPAPARLAGAAAAGKTLPTIQTRQVTVTLSGLAYDAKTKTTTGTMAATSQGAAGASIPLTLTQGTSVDNSCPSQLSGSVC